MDVTVKPELEKFVNDQVESGRFTSKSEAIEAGIARLMLDPERDDLDTSEIKMVESSLDELREGKSIDWRDFSSNVRQKYSGK